MITLGIIAGLILATWVACAPGWRPIVAYSIGCIVYLLAVKYR